VDFIYIYIGYEFLKMVETVPSSFGSWTPTNWEASFWASDSGRGKHKGKHRCITLMIWPMGGRVVDREGWRG
jgi:hypothetical protein